MEEIEFISRERLQTYISRTNRVEKAVALHNHTLQLGSSLMSMLALLELALRNKTNSQIIKDFGEEDWLLNDIPAIDLQPFEKSSVSKAKALAQKEAYSKLSYKQKAELDVEAFPDGVPSKITHNVKVKERQKTLPISHGQIISQSTFHFWKRLYSSDYERTLWRRSLKRVFPNKKLSRSDVSTRLEIIYKVRNRVAHHEPVYESRLEEVVEALKFMRDNLGSVSNDSGNFRSFSRIQYLRLMMDYESFKQAWLTLSGS